MIEMERGSSKALGEGRIGRNMYRGRRAMARMSVLREGEVREKE